MKNDRDIIVKWLTENLEERGHGARKALADFLNIDPTAVTKMTNGGRSITAQELIWMSEFFEDAPPIREPFRQNVVPVMGYVGAGGEIRIEGEQPPPEGFEQVEIPFSMPKPMVAFEVHGDSMYPSYDPGEMIICFRDQIHDANWFIGKTAIARAQSGHRYLKRISRGARRGTFTLHSSNAEPIENERIEWFGEIVASVKPVVLRHVGRKLTSRNKQKEEG